MTPIRYDLTVRIDFDQQRLDGTARTTLRNFSDTAVNDIPLLLYRLMEIRAALVNGSPAPWTQRVTSFSDFSKLQVTEARVTLPTPLPPGGTIDLQILELEDGYGSQADVAAIMQTAAAFRDSTRDHELYHEVAHLWNPPSQDLPSPRWNEGLSEFLEYLAEEQCTGKPGASARADQLLDWLRRIAHHPLVGGDQERRDLPRAGPAVSGGCGALNALESTRARGPALITPGNHNGQRGQALAVWDCASTPETLERLQILNEVVLLRCR